MRIVATTYVDHQVAVGYPVAHVARSLLWADHVYILASDDANATALPPVSSDPELAERCSVHVVGAKVGSPSDIARAWNKAIEWTLRSDDCDYLLISPADTLATAESASYCREFCGTPGSIARVAQFPIQESKLFHDFGAGYGHTLMGRKWNGKFSEACDGSKLAGDGHDLRWWRIRSTLHIGYLSIDMAYRHQRHESAGHLWGGHYPWLAQGCRIYESKGRDAFVRYMLPVLKKVHNIAHYVPVDEVDPRFTPVIDQLGLREEQQHVTRLAKTL